MMEIGKKIKERGMVYCIVSNIGVLFCADKGKYDGEWVEDKKEGRGVFNYSNGEIYDGDWSDDKKNGQGN